jgi:hypothetical protein
MGFGTLLAELPTATNLEMKNLASFRSQRLKPWLVRLLVGALTT